MVAKCFQRGCEFSEEGVAHMDAAMDVIREHFRAEHPSKAYGDQDYRWKLDSYNRTSDEWLASMPHDANGQPDPRYLGEYLTYPRDESPMPQDVREELQGVYDNWRAAQQNARPARRGIQYVQANPFAAPAVPLVQFDPQADVAAEDGGF